MVGYGFGTGSGNQLGQISGSGSKYKLFGIGSTAPPEKVLVIVVGPVQRPDILFFLLGL